jgi:hypothetical protein
MRSQGRLREHPAAEVGGSGPLRSLPAGLRACHGNRILLAVAGWRPCAGRVAAKAGRPVAAGQRHDARGWLARHGSSWATCRRWRRRGVLQPRVDRAEQAAGLGPWSRPCPAGRACPGRRIRFACPGRAATSTWAGRGPSGLGAPARQAGQPRSSPRRRAGARRRVRPDGPAGGPDPGHARTDARRGCGAAMVPLPAGDEDRHPLNDARPWRSPSRQVTAGNENDGACPPAQ